MEILAHRYNLAGADPATENRLPALHRALAAGFGLETDVRFADGFGFYISHDPKQPLPEDALEAHAAVWRTYPTATIALNVKEIGYERDLVASLNALGVAAQVFLFDMELIEPVKGETARRYRHFSPTIALGARISDRSESVERALSIDVANLVWLDEFDAPWACRDVIANIHATGRKIFAVAPDLHGYPRKESMARCLQFAAWSIDGLCTDWPLQLRNELSQRPQISTELPCYAYPKTR